ncbi:MAG: hypothetical protein DI524_14595 [Ectopseudomonas oleovorans]|nr:MAG: hypothetical protein DI524_14595 [Pseudomonas oleovorans]
MMLLGLSLKEMLDLLEQAGVLVSYHSLRTFLKKHLPAEYRECMAIGSSKGINPESGGDQNLNAQFETQPAPQALAAADQGKSESVTSLIEQVLGRKDHSS